MSIHTGTGTPAGRWVRLFLLLALLPAGLWLSGCGAEQPVDGPVVEGPVRGGTIVLGWTSDADVLNPVVQQTLLASHVNTLIYPNPTTEVFEDCRLTVQPLFAESWTHGEDGLSLTMRLRTDVLWEDGRPVSADDVIMSGGED